jgi:hypothetical protein
MSVRRSKSFALLPLVKWQVFPNRAKYGKRGIYAAVCSAAGLVNLLEDVCPNFLYVSKKVFLVHMGILKS